MAFGRVDRPLGSAPMGEINMVPLIDVMLVLLVIFIITAPLLTHAVKIDLPKVSSSVTQSTPDRIELAIDADGKLFWNGEPTERRAAAARFEQEARREPQPELHVRADRDARYRFVAEVMADAARGGLTKIGFVSLPDGRP